MSEADYIPLTGNEAAEMRRYEDAGVRIDDPDWDRYFSLYSRFCKEVADRTDDSSLLAGGGENWLHAS